MFDIGWTEMVLLVVIILLIMGPRELPVMVRTIGRTIGNLRTMAFNFRRQIELSVVPPPQDEAQDKDTLPKDPPKDKDKDD